LKTNSGQHERDKLIPPGPRFVQPEPVLGDEFSSANGGSGGNAEES